ncbi:DUF1840 domain-containing protein [Hydrogenophaga sp. OTU3427]|uniref:DUF1840 domain-containing protein n=1 Tax=Hydrogenophaga sp. OTU3427 TaxID=3043856 RepID=UPI00313EB76F
MLYRFKSRATADLVMLEASGRRVLEILGKDPGAPGILLVAQMPAAVSALQEAVRADEAERERQAREAQDRDEPLPEPADSVTLRMRCAPFIEMVQHSLKEQADIVWGV